MARPAAFLVIVLAFVTSGAFVAHVPAQQPAPVQTELLAEVRLLRQAIESLAGTNARVQIVFGRLQLQDQRTESAANKLDAVRGALTKVMSEISGMSDHLKLVENIVNDGRRKPEEIEQAREEVTGTRRALERMELDRARLAAEEADAASALNQEQGRWSDLNRQLDELERLLTKPPR
jgi:chromosome segregation ATPase